MEGLSLTEYSNKYRVSISTLRRKIKTGKIPFNLKSGKYFLADQSPEKQKNQPFTKALDSRFLVNNEGSPPPAVEKPPQNASALEAKDTVSAVNDPKEYKAEFKDPSFEEPSQKKKGDIAFASSQAVLSKLVDSQRELLKQVEKKDEIINAQKDKIADLSTLTAFLEKENRQLKSLLHEEKQIEEWLEAPPSP